MLTDLYKNIFVIGGNAAGLAAASQARRENPDIDITVLESGSYISYGACGLPYYISGIIKDITSIFTYPPSFFEEKRKIKILTGHRVVSLNPFRKEITACVPGNADSPGNESSKIFEYDKLIICSGAKPALIDIPGVNAGNVFYFRDISDALRLKKYIDEKNPSCACVIGGGSTGLLLAESLIKLGIKVSIIESSHRILSDYEDEVTAFLSDSRDSSGILAYPGNLVTSSLKIIPDSRAVALNISTSTGLAYSVSAVTGYDMQNIKKEIDADLVIISAGITANTSFISGGQIDMGQKNAIKVSGMQQTSHTNIYAAGDCCLVKNIITGSYEYIPTANNAIKSGRVAGANAAGGHDVFTGSADTKTDRIFGTELARTGISFSRALEYKFDAMKITDTYPSHIKALPGASNILITLIIDKSTRRLLGAQMSGKDCVSKRIDVFAAALAGEFTIDQVYMMDSSYAPEISTAPDAINRICGKAISILKSLKS